MKELGLFTVYDVVAEEYFPPFGCGNSAEAVRQFGDLLKDPRSVLNKHVEDYRLYRVARYRADTGVIYPLEVPELLCDGADLFKPTMAKEA